MSDPKPLSEIVHSSWVEALSPVEQTIHEIGARLREEVAAGHGYLPAGTDVLRAFTYPMDDVRVLIATDAAGEGIDLQVLARMTEGLTGADLSHVCDSAAENALMDSVRTSRPRLMNMKDMYAALKEVRPSSGPWFETARAVVEYADVSGEYAELREWMKRHRML